MTLPPMPPSPGAQSSAGTQCWKCHQVVQAGSVSCIWCGVIQQVAPTQFLVAPVPGGQAQAAPQPIMTSPAPQSALRGTATLGPEFVGSVASTGARLAAFTIDVLAIFGTAMLVTLLTTSLVYGLIALVEVTVGMWVLEARTGLTVGNALLRLRASRNDAPYSPGAGRSFVRWSITGVAFLAGAVGAWIVVASSAWDTTGKGRSWADRAAHTVVVAVPPRAPRVAAIPRNIGQLQHIPTQAMGATPGVQPGALPPGAPLHYPEPLASAAQHAGVPVMPQPALSVPPLAESDSDDQLSESIILAAPQVISTAARLAVVDEDSLSTSSTAAGGQTFVASTVPVIDTPVSGLIAGMISTGDAEAPSVDGTLLLIFDTGQREQLGAPVTVNLGRNPTVTEPGDKLVTVTDPDSTVSKTHLRLEHSRGRTWLTDGGSTNGTELLSDDGDSVVLVAGERVLLDDGVRVRIGDRTFTVSVLLGSEKA